MQTEIYDSTKLALSVSTSLSIAAAFIFVITMIYFERLFFAFMLKNQNETLAPSNFAVKVTFKQSLESLASNTP